MSLSVEYQSRQGAGYEMFVNNKYQPRCLCLLNTRVVQGAGYIMFMNSKYLPRYL